MKLDYIFFTLIKSDRLGRNALDVLPDFLTVFSIPTDKDNQILQALFGLLSSEQSKTLNIGIVYLLWFSC